MKTILIIDDEAKIREVYKNLFSSQGFKVIIAPNAAEAYDILLREKVDLSLLDINMPQIDGSIMHQLMKAFHKKTKVIVCSVYPVDYQQQIIKEAADYYDKSSSLDELLGKVKKVLSNTAPKRQILVIDDDTKVQTLFNKLLTNAGYYPVHINSGEKAVGYMEKHGQEVDLIILDLNMPGLDGVDFFEMLKNKQPTVKVIISSVYPTEEQKSNVFNADDYYDKSDNNGILLEKIAKLLN